MTDEPLGPIETAFAAAAGAIDGVRSALDYEPETLPPRPCVTMLFSRVAQDDVATGPATDNWWEWRVNVYVDLSVGASKDYRGAQAKLKALVPAVLAIVRRDQRLDETAIRAELLDEGHEPVFDHDQGLVWKSLRLRALTEET